MEAHAGHVGQIWTGDGEGLGLLQLPDELLVGAVTMESVDPALLQLMQRFKQTSKRIYHAFRVYMHGSPGYQHALENMFCVTGTQIPCWAETVTALPLPMDLDALMLIFNENAAMFEHDDNAVQVGGAYRYLHADLRPEFDDCFSRNSGEFVFVAVEIQFGPLVFFKPPRVPVLDGNLADLSKVPNIFRRVMSFLGLTHDYADIHNNAPDVAKYMRLVRVKDHHTMQDVQIAIASAEGWNQVDECVMYMQGGDEYESTDNVFFEYTTANQAEALIFPSVWFSCE